MNIKARAATVSSIFDFLSWAVLVIGALAAVGLLIGAGSWQGALFVLVAGFYTVIAWASLTLAALVAGYIHQKADH
jgi:hypothetical protein